MEYFYETDRLSGRQALLEGDGAAGGAGRAAKRSDKLVPACRYAHGLAPRRRDALCRWYGGAVGLDGGALELWPVLGHERFYLAILGDSEPQGHSPRHGTWPSDGDFYFDGFFRCGILRAGVGAGTFQQRPCRRGCGLPVFAHRVLFLSGCCLDVSFVERSARDGAGEAAAVCLHRHDDCKRLCGLRSDFRRLRASKTRCGGRGARDVYFLMAGSCPDPRLLSIREEPPDGAGQGTLCVLSSRRGRVLYKGPSCHAQRRPLGARHADAQPYLREHRLRVLRGHDDFQDLLRARVRVLCRPRQRLRDHGRKVDRQGQDPARCGGCKTVFCPCAADGPDRRSHDGSGEKTARCALCNGG